jgi:hypothetical protein
MIGPAVGLEREMFIHFHDHEHARAEQMNLQGLNARVLDAPRDFGPDFVVISPVFRDQFWIVLQVVLTPIFATWSLFIPQYGPWNQGKHSKR